MRKRRKKSKSKRAGSNSSKDRKIDRQVCDCVLDVDLRGAFEGSTERAFTKSHYSKTFTTLSDAKEQILGANFGLII